MLRFDHMPSDFHPIFLFLGDSEELGKLADLLLIFELEPNAIDVRQAIPESEGRAQLTIVPGEGEDAPYGLRLDGDDDQYIWVLNSWQAGQVAARIEALLQEELKSGNDILEFGVEGEIPVKVSRGEFTDNFLTPKHHLHPEFESSAGS